MNRLIRIGILWCLAISTGRAQEAVRFKEASQAPTLETEEPSPLPASEVRPVNGQPSPFQPEKSKPPRRVAEPKRIVIQPGVDAQESEVVWQFLADLEKAGIAKVIETEMTPTSESPIVTQVFMREDESFEKIKLFLVDLRASGVEKLVLEFGGLHPEGDADKQHNGLVFRATKGYSQDELQRLEKVVQAASERCGVSLYLAGTHVVPSGPELVAPPDKKPGVLDAEGYAPGPGSPQPVTKTVVPSSKAIVLVIDADAQESEVVKEGIAALEKAGIATGQSAKTATPTDSPIRVTLNMRKDESYDKIKQLMEALKDAGVQQMSLRLGGVQYQGKEINQLKVNLQPGYSPAEYEKINRATIAVMERCGLSLLRSRNWLPGEADVKHPLDDVNLPVLDSSERTNPAMDSGFIPKSSQTAELRTQYEAANKQAHDLAESLRQTPDAAKKSALRTAVQRAFTLRQSLLRAELQEMQARLEKTQQSLDMRDRMADQIVDRRVEDLLNPQLKWDDSALPSTKDSSPKIGTAARYNADADGDNSPERTGFSEISLRIPEKQFVPDPGTPALRVTYDDLDLFKILNMEPVPANAVEYFPDWLQALNGKTVRIRGFMYPTFEAHSLKQFTLARHNDICCFVRNPKIYDVIGVSLGEGITTDYIDGRPFDVEGTFNIEPKADENRLTRLYRISEARILPVAAEDMDPQTEDLSNVQSNEVNDYPIQVTGPNNSSANASAKPKIAQPVTELEGDWHRVGASVDQTGAETPHFNITIHGSTWTKFVEGKPEAVEFLRDTTKKTIEFKSTPPLVYTYEMHGDAFILHNETQSQAFNRGLRLQPDVLSELEGDWHQVSATDKDGKPLTVPPVNMSFKKDQYTLAYQGGQNNRRVEVFSGKKEIRYFQEGEYNGFVQDHYLLEGDQLTIYDENRRNVFQRGHVALPKSIPAATDEQKSLWRSGIVEIIVQQRDTAAEPQVPYGYGVIVSPQGLIISQLKLSDGDWNFFAKFDDGGVIPIKLVEEGIHGWIVFQPEQPIEVNHHFRFSAAAVGKADEVNFWGRAAVPGNHPTLVLAKSNVTALDRKSPALGLAVWQLHSHQKLDASLPILDGNGDVHAISAIGTGDLFLAVPVSQLKTIFPKSLGLLTDTEKPAEPPIGR